MLILENYSDQMDQKPNKIAGYYIMPKYSINLEEYLSGQSSIDKIEILKVCKQLIDAMEIVHASGRTYNDLKPQNVMLEMDENE